MLKPQSILKIRLVAQLYQIAYINYRFLQNIAYFDYTSKF
jgi:hypothetical protein